MTAVGRGWIGLAFVLFALAVALPRTAGAAAPRFPPLTGRVVDEARILPSATVSDLTAKLAALEARTSRQLVVVTVSSLQGYEIEDYGYQLGRAWGLGRKGIDNGALLIVAPNERKVRVEVGYGLEGVVTDALSSVILQSRVLPRFRAGDIPAGVVAGTDALIDQLSLDPSTAEQRAAAAAQAGGGEPGGAPAALIVFILVLFFVIQGVLRRRRSAAWLAPVILGGGWGRGDRWGGGGWSGGGGGGGFSGGGGSFGGGGSSGSW